MQRFLEFGILPFSSTKFHCFVCDHTQIESRAELKEHMTGIDTYDHKANLEAFRQSLVQHSLNDILVYKAGVWHCTQCKLDVTEPHTHLFQHMAITRQEGGDITCRLCGDDFPSFHAYHPHTLEPGPTSVRTAFREAQRPLVPAQDSGPADSTAWCLACGEWVTDQFRHCQSVTHLTQISEHPEVRIHTGFMVLMADTAVCGLCGGSMPIDDARDHLLEHDHADVADPVEEEEMPFKEVLQRARHASGVSRRPRKDLPASPLLVVSPPLQTPPLVVRVRGVVNAEGLGVVRWRGGGEWTAGSVRVDGDSVTFTVPTSDSPLVEVEFINTNGDNVNTTVLQLPADSFQDPPISSPAPSALLPPPPLNTVGPWPAPLLRIPRLDLPPLARLREDLLQQPFQLKQMALHGGETSTRDMLRALQSLLALEEYNKRISINTLLESSEAFLHLGQRGGPLLSVPEMTERGLNLTFLDEVFMSTDHGTIGARVLSTNGGVARLEFLSNNDRMKASLLPPGSPLAVRMRVEPSLVSYRRLMYALEQAGSPVRRQVAYDPGSVSPLHRTALLLGCLEPSEEERMQLTGVFDSSVPSHQLPWLNRLQTEAVRAILRGDNHPGPFLLLGPAGTGKTETVIAAAALAATAGQRVLMVCASNSAANNAAARLPVIIRRVVDLRRAGGVCPPVFRLLAPSADPPELSCLSNVEKGEIRAPTLRELKSPVVVTTLETSLQLARAGTPPFDLLLVEEASQSTIPQMLLPLGALKGGARVCFSGDPRQLGPVVFSPISKVYGLGCSLLERLEPLAASITLEETYRSHPGITEVYNTHFYQSKLKDAAPRSKTHVPGITGHPLLFPARTCPLTFVHTGGSASSTAGPGWPSLGNPEEVKMVAALLRGAFARGVPSDSVAVLSPYRRQVSLLTQALCPGTPAMTIEKAQGTEHPLVVVSLTRSVEAGSLGFLVNPKRACVAVSRACAGLVLVGDARLLVRNKIWRGIMKTIWNNGTWIGQTVF